MGVIAYLNELCGIVALLILVRYDGDISLRHITEQFIYI